MTAIPHVCGNTVSAEWTQDHSHLSSWHSHQRTTGTVKQIGTRKLASNCGNLEVKRDKKLRKQVW